MMTNLLSDNYISEMMTYAKQARSAWQWMDNANVDHIIASILDGMPSLSSDLARACTEETRMGIYEDKLLILNRTLNDIRRQYLPAQTHSSIRLSGMNSRSQSQPIGIMAGITDGLQPAASVLFECMTAIRTRNPLILSFHPSAYGCSYSTAAAIRDLAVSAGAPDNCIQWLDEDAPELLEKLLHGQDIAALMASGQPDALRRYLTACKSPAALLRPSTVFCYIHQSADLSSAIHQILLSRTFDNGLHIGSEQIICTDQAIYEQLKEMLQYQGCYLASPEEITRLTAVLIDLSADTVNPAVTGQSPQTVAAMADITIPDDTRLIAMEMNMDRSDHPLLVPFQCPAVVLMPVEQNEQAADKIRQLSTPETDFSTDILSLMQEEAMLPPSNSLVIHAADRRVISSMSRSLPDFTLIENAPAAGQSLTGQYINRYGSKLDAVSMGQLFSVSRTLSQTPDSPHTFRIPATIHFQKGALEKLKFADHQTRITFLYSDEDTLPSHTSSIIRQICQRYPSLKYQHVPLPRDAASGRSSEYFLTQLARTAPDCLIAMGGSQMMTAAKRLFNDYRQMLHGENSAFSGVPPQMEGEQPIQPEPGLILIPSLDGCHTALLPFCGYYDSQTNTLEDRAVHIEDLTIIADTHMASPGSDIASPGGDMTDEGSIFPACMAAMADAFDAYLSNQGDDLTDAMALQAIALFLAWLPKLPDNMSSDAPDIRSQSSAMEHLQNACLLSGMAAAHTGIGLSRTMAGRLYCDFRLPTQTTQALLLPHILQYNGDIRPSKNAWILPACGYSMSDKILRLYQTAQMAASISPLVEPLTPPDMTRQLANIIQRILKQADIPRTIKACGIREKDYMLRIDIMAQKTFDQLSTTCADTNPRYPLIKEIVQLYRQIYE